MNFSKDELVIINQAIYALLKNENYSETFGKEAKTIQNKIKQVLN